VPLIPIDNDDIPAERALRAEFGRFWLTEQGDPRAVYDRFIAATPLATDVTAQHVTDDPGPGVWVRPADAAPDRALLFLHGGGYGVGSAPAYIGLVSQIAARAHVAAFALEYPLAPESQLPEALDLAVQTLDRICCSHAAVAIAGDSAGGGLALSTTARAVQQGLQVAAVAVFSPWTDLSLSGTSVRKCQITDPLLDPAYLRDSAAAYLGSAAREDPRASPLFGTMAGLPPLLIQVGTDEVLLDDSRRFALAAVNAGSAVRLEVWEGMHHVFQLNVEQLVSARRALDSAGEFLSSHLDDWANLLR
jgi:monoterpene epsilon-lactone hydrolase